MVLLLSTPTLGKYMLPLELNTLYTHTTSGTRKTSARFPNRNICFRHQFFSFVLHFFFGSVAAAENVPSIIFKSECGMFQTVKTEKSGA